MTKAAKITRNFGYCDSSDIDGNVTREKKAAFTIKVENDEVLETLIPCLEKTEFGEGNTSYGEEDGEIVWIVTWEEGEQKQTFAAFKKTVRAIAKEI